MQGSTRLEEQFYKTTIMLQKSKKNFFLKTLNFLKRLLSRVELRLSAY